MIDIGANLTNKSFANDIQAVLNRSQTAGVTKILVTGTDIESSQAAVVLAKSHPNFLYATAGVHPHHASEIPSDWLDDLRKLTDYSRVVAIGETGLDFYRDFSTHEDQIRVFELQLDFAAELDLPLFVHDRDSNLRTLDCLLSHARTPVVVHCFTGSRDELHRYLDFGCHIGITGWICDPKRGQELFRIVPDIPDDRLLIETDAPYLMPKTMPSKPRARRNEPEFLIYVAKALAAARNQSEESIQQITSENAMRLFRL